MESELDIEIDILSLYALRQIQRLADDFADNQMDLLSLSHGNMGQVRQGVTSTASADDNE